MRHTLRAFRNNPIAPSAASEMVEYTRQTGGFLRVSYRGKDGSKQELLTRPERVALVARNVRDGERVTIDMGRVQKMSPIKGSSDLQVKYTRPDGQSVSAALTPEGFYLVGQDLRTIGGEPARATPEEKASINLKNMFTMAYRPEKDVDAIVTDEGGAFRFLNMKFPVEIPVGGQKYGSAYEALVGDGDEDDLVGKPKLEAAVAEALRLKFRNPTMQRWLIATGERPFALPPFADFDYNEILEKLREEAIRGGVQPAAPPPARPALARSALLGEQSTAEAVEEAKGYIHARATQLRAYAEANKAPDTPEITVVDPYKLRHGEERPYDAIIHVRAYQRKNMDKVPDILAAATPPLPHYVIDEPANIEDEKPIKRALRWLLEHPHWKNIAISAASYNPNSSIISRQTLDYLSLVEAGLMDPALRAEVNKDIVLRYTEAGDVISPVGGTVVGVQKTSTAYKIALRQPFKLRYTLHAFRELADALTRVESGLNHDTKPFQAIERANEELSDAAYRDKMKLRKDEPIPRTLETPEGRAPSIAHSGRLSSARSALLDDVRNLEVEVAQQVQAAQDRINSIEPERDPIHAARKDYEELNKARKAAIVAADLVGRYIQLVKRAESAAQALAPRSREMEVLATRIEERINAPASGLAAYYKALKKRVDSITKHLGSMEREQRGLMSESQSERLRALAALYPGYTAETQYQYEGRDLYRYDFLSLPLTTPPLNVKPGDVLSIGSIIEVGGRRTDIPAVRPERYEVDTMVIIWQEQAINCAPVSFDLVRFPTMTDRDAIANFVNKELLELADDLRVKSVHAKVMQANKEEMKEELQRISTALGPGNYIETCDKPRLVEDPVFYVILMGPRGSYRLHESGAAPGEPRWRRDFLTSVEEEYGPSSRAYYEEGRNRFMSDLPMDTARVPLMTKLNDYVHANLQKVRDALADPAAFKEKEGIPDLLAKMEKLPPEVDPLTGQPFTAEAVMARLEALLHLRYRSTRPFEAKEIRETRKEAQRQITQAEMAQRYFSLGVPGAGSSGMGKVYIGKEGKGPAQAGGLGTVSALQPGRYEPGTGGVMVLSAGKGSKGEGLGSAYVVGKGDRFRQYMDQIDELRKVLHPTERELAMARLRRGREAERAERGVEKAAAGESDPFDIKNFQNPRPRKPMRRLLRNSNGEPPDDDFNPFGEEDVPSAPPQPKAPPPSASVKEGATAEAVGLFPKAGAAPGAAEGSRPEEMRINVLREATADSWKRFSVALRSRPKGEAKKETAADLKPLMQAYAEALSALESALDARDRRLLAQPKGEALLREKLREEAAANFEDVRGIYKPPPRGETYKTGEKQRLRGAELARDLVDAFGRPLSPPSESEMNAAGLPALDLSVARVLDTTLTAAARARAMPIALNYAQLKEAAAVAAAAEKRSAGGMSTSSVTCRVMSEGNRIRTVASDLAAREPLHQLIFGRFGAGEEVRRYKTIILWISPDDSHVIFYVNGTPTCEFHAQSNFVHLLTDVLHYTEDWFNDPREIQRRKEYRVLIGKSGCNALYQIWGAASGIAGSRYKRHVGPFVAEVAGETIITNGLLSANGSFVCAEKAPGTFRWVTDSVIKRFGGSSEDPEADIITAERQAYAQAVAQKYGGRVGKFGVAVGSAARFKDLAASSAIQAFKAALKTPRNHMTLYYPAMYVAGGDLAKTDNASTAADLRRQLDAFVKYAKTHPGSKFTIIDASLFSDSTLRSAIVDFDEFNDADFFRPPYPGGQQQFARAVPPFQYLRTKLNDAKIKATIEVVIRSGARAYEDEEVLPLIARYEDPANSTTVTFKRTEGHGAFDALTKDFEPGSSLVLWNDPDFEDEDTFFGRRDGLRNFADFIVANLGLFHDIEVDSAGHEKLTDGTKLTPTGVEMKGRFLMTPPQILREEVLTRLAASLKASMDVGRGLSAALGLPDELVEVIEQAVPKPSARGYAEAALAVVAKAYGVRAEEYFHYGFRLRPKEEASSNPNRRRAKLYGRR